jgi:hypothetical protein
MSDAKVNQGENVKEEKPTFVDKGFSPLWTLLAVNPKIWDSWQERLRYHKNSTGNNKLSGDSSDSNDLMQYFLFRTLSSFDKVRMAAGANFEKPSEFAKEKFKNLERRVFNEFSIFSDTGKEVEEMLNVIKDNEAWRGETCNAFNKVLKTRLSGNDISAENSNLKDEITNAINTKYSACENKFQAFVDDVRKLDNDILPKHSPLESYVFNVTKKQIYKIPTNEMLEFLFKQPESKCLNKDKFLREYYSYDLYEGFAHVLITNPIKFKLTHALSRSAHIEDRLDETVERNLAREHTIRMIDDKPLALQDFTFTTLKDFTNLMIRYSENQKLYKKGHENPEGNYGHYSGDYNPEGAEKVNEAIDKMKGLYVKTLNPVVLEILKIKTSIVNNTVDFLEKHLPQVLSFNNKMLDKIESKKTNDDIKKLFGEALDIISKNHIKDGEINEDFKKFKENINLAVDGISKLQGLRRADVFASK